MGGGPHFSKSWSSRFARKCNEIGGGGGSGRSVKKWSLRLLKSKQRIACVPDHLKRKDFSFKWSGAQTSKRLFSRVGSKVLVSKKCSNSAGRGILSQSRMHIFKNSPGVLLPDPLTSNVPCYLSLNMPMAIGIPVCCHC